MSRAHGVITKQWNLCLLWWWRNVDRVYSSWRDNKAMEPVFAVVVMQRRSCLELMA